MKSKIIIPLSLLLFVAYAEKPQGIEAKKIELKNLKGQFTELKTQISTLEKEVAKLDTFSKGGVPVRIVELAETPFSHYIEQPGNVTSKENVTVSSEMGGIVKAIMAEEGQWVNKGQSILQLDAAVLSNQVEDLRQQNDLARTTLSVRIICGKRESVLKYSFYKLKMPINLRKRDLLLQKHSWTRWS